MSARCPYKSLGVEPGASADELRSAARRARSDAHPDRAGGSHDRMAEVNWAAGILLDEAKRAEWDATGACATSTEEERASQLLAELAVSVLKGPDVADITAEMLRRVNAVIENGQREAAAAETIATTIERRARNVKAKPGRPNVVAGVAAALAKDHREAAAKILKQVELQKAVRERLLGDFDITQALSGVWHSTNSGTVAQGVFFQTPWR